MRSSSSTFTGDARRAQIVECAIETIAVTGFAQASIRKIADRVGIAMSAVLYHFGNKDKLVVAVIEHMFRTALAVVVPAMDAESTATDKLSAYIRASIEYFDTNRMHLVALTQLPRFGELELSAELSSQLTALDPTSVLRSGQRSGEFSDFPIDSIAIALRGAVNAAVEKILGDPDFDARRYGLHLVEAFGRIVAVQS
jgi:AcrR family transcriptional regulator